MALPIMRQARRHLFPASVGLAHLALHAYLHAAADGASRHALLYFRVAAPVVLALMAASWLRAARAPRVAPRAFPAAAAALLKTRLKKRDGSPRWCRQCSVYKPDRAHHCRLCGVCVPVMDHHSPFLGTCVGHHNVKFHTLFQVYAVCHATTMCIGISYLIFGLGLGDQGRWALLRTTGILASILAMLLAGGHGLICFMNLRPILSGYTTIEWHEERRRDPKLWGKSSPYSKGNVWADVMHIFGANPLFMLPVNGPDLSEGVSPTPSPEGATRIAKFYSDRDGGQQGGETN